MRQSTTELEERLASYHPKCSCQICDKDDPTCAGCDDSWPCDTAQLIAALRAERAARRRAIRWAWRYRQSVRATARHASYLMTRVTHHMVERDKAEQERDRLRAQVARLQDDGGA